MNFTWNVYLSPSDKCPVQLYRLWNLDLLHKPLSTKVGGAPISQIPQCFRPQNTSKKVFSWGFQFFPSIAQFSLSYPLGSSGCHKSTEKVSFDFGLLMSVQVPSFSSSHHPAHNHAEMFFKNVFRYQKKVLVIKKNFWNSRLKAKNFQKFLDH